MPYETYDRQRDFALHAALAALEVDGGTPEELRKLEIAYARLEHHLNKGGDLSTLEPLTETGGGNAVVGGGDRSTWYTKPSTFYSPDGRGIADYYQDAANAAAKRAPSPIPDPRDKDKYEEWQQRMAARREARRPKFLTYDEVIQYIGDGYLGAVQLAEAGVVTTKIEFLAACAVIDQKEHKRKVSRDNSRAYRASRAGLSKARERRSSAQTALKRVDQKIADAEKAVRENCLIRGPSAQVHLPRLYASRERVLERLGAAEEAVEKLSTGQHAAENVA